MIGWFEQHYTQAIDARIEADLEAGPFDPGIRRALSNYEAGKTEPL